jgi:hypothetical protein
MRASTLSPHLIMGIRCGGMATTGEPENLFRQASRRLRLRLFW